MQMSPGQYQMHQNVLLMAAGCGTAEPDYEEKYDELLDIVRAVVDKNPNSVDSRLVDYLEEND